VFTKTNETAQPKADRPQEQTIHSMRPGANPARFLNPDEAGIFVRCAAYSSVNKSNIRAMGNIAARHAI
jgi:hypothetical protein